MCKLHTFMKSKKKADSDSSTTELFNTIDVSSIY